MNLRMTKTLLIINLVVLVIVAIGSQQPVNSNTEHNVNELKDTIASLQDQVDDLQDKVAMYEEKLITLSNPTKDLVEPSQDEEKLLSTQDIERELVSTHDLFQPGKEAKKELKVKYEGIILDRPGALRYEQFPFIPKTYVADTEILSTSKTYDVDKVRKVLEILAPEIVGIEDALLIQYEHTGIKPEIIFGIIGIESSGKSGMATSRLAKDKNNMVGWNAYPSATKTVYQNASTFYSKSDCVMILGQSLYKNYITKGYGTLEKISVKYCGGNPVWSRTIRSFAKKFIDTYNSL